MTEVRRPALVAEKEQLLADPAARDQFLTQTLAGATKALVLTEGLLM